MHPLARRRAPPSRARFAVPCSPPCCCSRPARRPPRSPTTTRATSPTPTACRQRLDPLWHEESGQYRPGPGGVDALVNSLLLLTHSVAAQQGHTGPARNDHRARLIARALVSPPVFIERPPPTRGGLADARARDGRARCGAPTRASTSCSTPRSSTGSCTPGRRAARSGCPRDGGEDRGSHPPRRVVALLSLADDPPQPGQLVRADVRRRRDGDRPPGAAAARPARAARPLRRGARGGATSAPACASSTCRTSRPTPAQPRFRRVREHRALVPALLRPGAARRHGPALARGPQPRPALGAAGDRRLLDPRRLPQLGHRPRVRALAPGQEARARAAGADRDRADAEAAADERLGAWAKWMLDRGLALLRAAAGGGGRAARPGAVQALHRSAERRQRAARRRAAAGQRRPRGRGRSRAHARRRAAARCTRSIPTSAASPSPRPSTTPRSSRSTSARSHTAASSSRACSTPISGVAANVGGRAPAAFGLLVRQPDGRRVFSSQTARARTDPAVTPLRLTRAPTGTGATAATAPGGRAFAGPFSDLRARGTLTAGRFRPSRRTASRRARSRPTGGSSAATGAPAARRRPDAELGRRAARVVAVLRDGTRLSLRGGRRAPLACRAVRDREPHSGYTVVPLRRPAGAVARVLHPSRQSSNPDPGPTLAIEIAQGSTWRRARFAARIAVAR